MNKAQLQAGLSFNSETLSKAENTLRRMQEQLQRSLLTCPRYVFKLY